MIMRISTALAVVLAMAGCGGGGSSPSAPAAQNGPPTVNPPARPTVVVAGLSTDAPRRDGYYPAAPTTHELNSRMYVGVASPPAPNALSSVGTQHGPAVRAGAVNDGEPASRVLDYLNDALSGQPARFSTPPVVGIIRGGGEDSSENISAVIQAVGFINGSLPYDKRIRFGYLPSRARADIAEQGLGRIPAGYIVVEYTSAQEAARWKQAIGARSNTIGVAFTDLNPDGSLRAALIVIDESVGDFLGKEMVAVHEIGHALGFAM